MTYRKEACIETIRCADSRLENLSFHNERMDRTRRTLFGTHDFLDLGELIQIPELLPSHVYKCRVTYTDRIESVEWEVYNRRTINSLRIVHDEKIDYTFKYSKRHDLDRIYSQRGKFDDVLIVRNGYLTDAYVCNIAFLDGSKWLTPANPLLKGTQRALLLHQNKIEEAPIHLGDLRSFTRVSLFNAMMPWPEAVVLQCDRIFD
jgi:4-amino-4-deoxychorismate lyase